MIEAWFDGVCEPTNPGGHAAYGVLIKVDGTVVLAEGKYVGHGQGISNNVAEYAGCIRVLEEVASIAGVVIVRGDSKLVINQLNGNWGANCGACGKPLDVCRCERPKPGLYYPFFQKANTLVEPLRARIKFEWIPRRLNDECDVLSKGVLHEMGIEFRLQPEAKS